MDEFGAHGRERARRRQRARRRRARTAAGLAFAVALGAVLAAALTLTGSGRGAGTRPAARSASGSAGGATPPAGTAPAPATDPRRVRIAAVGDTMLGSTPTLPPSPATYLDAVRAALRGDVVFGNLEGTLTTSSAGKCSPGAADCFAFRAPPEFARDLRAAGFTILSNANNHSYDFGQAGQDDTVRALHSAGIAQTGLPGEITVLHGAGLRIAFLGFAPYPNTASLIDLPAARALIRSAARRADIVVVAIHAGAEGTNAQHVTGAEEAYVGEDRGNARAFAHMAVDAGADLVLGSGPHVLRGMEIYQGRLIAYSLGNFAGYHNFGLTGALADSAVLRVSLSADGRFRHGRVVSVLLVDAGRPVPDQAGGGVRLVAELSRADFGPNAVRFGRRGTILAPRL